MKKVAFVISIVLIISLHTITDAFGQISLEAHRGGRGAMPENTIEAMKYAIEINEVTTLEMDLCVSEDMKVVVSHDTYFHPNITTTPEGKYLDTNDQRSRLLYSMSYDSIKKYDVGLKHHPDFPDQKRFPAIKPLLTVMIDSCENYAKERGIKMLYNMEIKSRKAGDNKEHPEPEVFVGLVTSILKEKRIINRTVIQSFDIRPLQIIHRKYPEIKLSYLVGVKAQGVDKMLERLGFSPYIYSPEYTTVNDGMIKECHKRGIKIVPWTVNGLEEINKLLDLGVDGIISDYPELFTKVKNDN